ncbi:kynurenine 3-monooxygenase [Xylaria sp. FL0064]|nr:kynurenine 3-monooxygenase [Xylaria sp. FL0064]
MTLTPPPPPPADVAVIGAGLAGLTLALALNRLKMQCTVYEARPRDHNPGGSLMISPNALRCFDSLGLYERLRDKALHFDKLHLTNDQDEVTDIYYFGFESRYQYQAIRIMRKELLDELLSMLQERGIPVHFDSTLDTVVDSAGPNSRVRFTFTNGHATSAALLVDADGIHSTVRSTFSPDVKPKYAGILGISCVPGGFLLVPQKPDGSELYVGAQRLFAELDDADWKALRRDQQKLYDMIHEDQANWPDIVQSALEGMSVDRMGCWAFYDLPLPSWLSASNRIILVGGAAHAIPPTDVYSLASLLSDLSPDVPLDKAAVLWQAYRQERIQKILDLTQQMNAKRLPESEKVNLPPGAIWTDSALTRGEESELGWLYNPDLSEETAKWVQELKYKAV